MLEYKGKYGKAKVMIDTIDQETISQIYEFLNHEAFTNPVAIMPDTHAGNGAVIGFTMEMTDKVIPNVVGVDINCGMVSFNVGKNILAEKSKAEIDSIIREEVPFGTNTHKNYPVVGGGFYFLATNAHSEFVFKFNKRFNTSYKTIEFNEEWLKNKSKEIGIEFDRVIKSVGTLGGGNHFIELGKSQMTGDYWFTVHSGSRQFGLKICNYWQKKAGHGALSYLAGDEMFGYLTDMVFAQKYAELNRTNMMHKILNSLNMKWLDPKETISTNHNFIDFNDFIIRKGAIRSYINEKMVIPFNMEDGILICTGKSNPEWNFSAPHGAGRLFSRKKAKETLKTKENDIKHRMKKSGIFCSKLPLDEVKESYKDPKIIEEAIEPTAEIIDRIVPVLAMKE